MRLIVKEEVFNPVYLPCFTNRSRYLILVGGAGSGKSVAAAQKIVLLLLGRKRQRWLMCRKIGLTIRNSSFRQIKEVIYQWGLSHLFHILESNLVIRCRQNGNEVISSGLDDVDKLKSITAVTGIWIEEATDILDEKEFLQLDMRVRGYVEGYKQIILTLNPIDEEHWIRKRWFPDARRGQKSFELTEENAHGQIKTSVLRTTFEDNRFLLPEDRALLEQLAGQDENMHRIYARGEWGRKTEGLIFPNWTVVPEFPAGADPISGLDFGIIAHTALVRVGLYEGKVYIDELLYEQNFTNTDLRGKLPELVRNRKDFIYADGAEKNRIIEIYRDGYNVHEADKDVEAGLDFVRSLPLCVTGTSENWMKEAKRYVFKKDREGKFLDSPVKMRDHLMDATRYAIYSHERKIPKYWTGDRKAFKKKSSGTGRQRRRGSTTEYDRM